MHLYPEAKSGNYKLSSEFEEFITWEEINQGFKGALNHLHGTLASRDGSRYVAQTYLPIWQFFIEMRELVRLKDADVELNFAAHSLFTGKPAKSLINVAYDTFFIVSIVNAFEGWRFFDHKERRSWQKDIDSLDTIRQQADILERLSRKEIFKELNHAMIRKDIEHINQLDILNEIPNSFKVMKHLKEVF